jgi:DNA invertase Pin-like site-specific DNA recombinase
LQPLTEDYQPLLPHVFSCRDESTTVLDTPAKGASLKAIDQPIDTGTAAGKLFLDMLGCFAEFETNIRKERQLEGIAKPKLRAFMPARNAPRRSRPTRSAG